MPDSHVLPRLFLNAGCLQNLANHFRRLCAVSQPLLSCLDVYLEGTRITARIIGSAPITDASDHFFKLSTANPDIQQIVLLLKQKNDSVEFTSKFINAFTKENQQEYVLAGRWKAISFFMK